MMRSRTFIAATAGAVMLAIGTPAAALASNRSSMRSPQAAGSRIGALTPRP